MDDFVPLASDARDTKLLSGGLVGAPNLDIGAIVGSVTGNVKNQISVEGCGNGIGARRNRSSRLGALSAVDPSQFVVVAYGVYNLCARTFAPQNGYGITFGD